VEGLKLAGPRVAAASTATARPFIDGAEERAEGLVFIDVENPARPSDAVGIVARCTAADVDRAVRAAEEAFPAWSGTTAARRAELMRLAADRLAERLPELTETVVLEVGKVVNDARGDVAGAIALLRSFADLAPAVEKVEDLTGGPGTGNARTVLLHKVPVGPVAVISPWNTPVYLTFNSVAPALIAGCTVVVKPPEIAPLALTAALAEVASLLPPGVLNVVPGRGSVVGDALAVHPGIRSVLFTGGTEAGSKVLAAAAGTIKKVSVELGGNDPALVLESAVIDEAMLREMIAGSFSVSGQVCFNIKRIYVHRSRYDEFLEKFTAMVDQLVVGDGFDPAAHIGPVTTKDGYENALQLISDAKANGALVHEGGQLGDGIDWEAGYFIRPTVVTNLSAGAELVLTEQFAPVIPILPFDDDEQAIREANRTEFGLASSIWSADSEHAQRVALRIEAGNTFINAHRVGASVPAVPFGGMKHSGLGRNHLMYSVEACMEEHAIVRYGNSGEEIPGIQHWSTLRLAGPPWTKPQKGDRDTAHS
jgi:aldehyde dehydrogenase